MTIESSLRSICAADERGWMDAFGSVFAVGCLSGATEADFGLRPRRVFFLVLGGAVVAKSAMSSGAGSTLFSTSGLAGVVSTLASDSSAFVVFFLALDLRFVFFATLVSILGSAAFSSICLATVFFLLVLVFFFNVAVVFFFVVVVFFANVSPFRAGRPS